MLRRQGQPRRRLGRVVTGPRLSRRRVRSAGTRTGDPLRTADQPEQPDRHRPVHSREHPPAGALRHGAVGRRQLCQIFAGPCLLILVGVVPLFVQASTTRLT